MGIPARLPFLRVLELPGRSWEGSAGRLPWEKVGDFHCVGKAVKRRVSGQCGPEANKQLVSL